MTQNKRNMELTLNITKDGLCPFIVKQGEDLYEMLQKARKELGGRYNNSNACEMLYIKFGDPRWKAEVFYDEYIRILKKESKVPASVRYTIKKVCDYAVQSYLAAYIEQENKKAKEQPRES